MLDKSKQRMVGEFSIEADVPIPGGSGSRPSKYPFADMEIGESFAFDRSKLNSVRNNAGSYAKRHDGVRFVCRQVGTDVWRCWKLERDNG
jgi:hypothetical protein